MTPVRKHANPGSQSIFKYLITSYKNIIDFLPSCEGMQTAAHGLMASIIINEETPPFNNISIRVTDFKINRIAEGKINSLHLIGNQYSNLMELK